MKCNLCPRKGRYTCPCSFSHFCSNHINLHLDSPGLHSSEKLNIPCSNEMLNEIKIETFLRIKVLKDLKANIFSISKKMIEKILNSSQNIIKKLDSQIQFYSKITNFVKFSNSLKTEVDKILKTNLQIKEFPESISNSFENIFTEDLISFVENEKVKGSNEWLLDKKIEFMDSLDINHFNLCFGKGEWQRNSTQEILFSKDGKYSFICNIYTGTIK